MRKTVWPVVAVFAVVAWAAMAPPVPADPGAQVLMVDNEPDLTNWHFDPATVTVPAGATVTWHNKGKEQHSVTADDKSFDSGLTKPGTDWQRTFPKVGLYSYHCAPHPWMTGKVRVVAASVVPASAATAAPTASPAPPTAAAAPAATTPPASAPGSAAGAPPGAGETTTTQAQGSAAAAPASAAGSAAAPTKSGSRSGGHLAGTIALVLGPTLAGLAVGAKLRGSRS